MELIGGGLLPYLLGAVGLVGAFFGVKRMGANGERRKQAEKRAETAQEARSIEDDVSKTSDTVVRNRIKLWMRDE
jgi:hypothetical protein